MKNVFRNSGYRIKDRQYVGHSLRLKILRPTQIFSVGIKAKSQLRHLGQQKLTGCIRAELEHGYLGRKKW